MRAWTETETFAFNGAVQPAALRQCLAAADPAAASADLDSRRGSVETWQWCAAMDYVYCYLSYYGYKAGQATMDGFWQEMARLGKDRNPYRAGFLQFVGVAETRAEALKLYAEPAEYFYGRCLHVSAKFANPPGYVSEATQRAGIESPGGARVRLAPPRYQDKFKLLAQEMNDIVERGYVIIGSPDEVAEQLREVAVNLNVGHLMLLLQFGNMNKDLTRYNTKLFAERVMPQLKDQFSDWEDRWWPQPMEHSLRAALPAFPSTVARGGVIAGADRVTTETRRARRQEFRRASRAKCLLLRALRVSVVIPSFIRASRSMTS